VLQVAPAPRGTLQDHVNRQLCELILNGEIAPGQLITTRALAEAFGVSAMPVREALRRLRQRGCSRSFLAARSAFHR
jgi:DNA-binding GntR family transcriptional regulator